MPQGSVSKQNHPGYVILPQCVQSFSALENYLSPSDEKRFLTGQNRTLSEVMCLRWSLFSDRLPCWQDNLLSAFFSTNLLPCSFASHSLSSFLGRNLQKRMITHCSLGEAQTELVRLVPGHLWKWLSYNRPHYKLHLRERAFFWLKGQGLDKAISWEILYFE